MMDKVIVGIDLGTTNSLLGIFDGNTVRFALEADSAIIPSVVSSSAVGAGALEHTGAVHSIKRFMGKTNDVIALGKTPIEISADILLYLKTLAEQQFGIPIEYAVITVPAYFDEPARAATKAAAQKAGLSVVRLISEPTAAAIAYGKDQGQEGQTYAIYDLGGGTFDVSIMTKHKGVLEVLATSGDTSLGGDDFDCIIGDIIAEQVGGNALNFKHIAKDIKQYLTDHPQWSGDIMGKPCMVKRSDFVSRAASLVSRTASLLMHALADAAVVAEDLAEVILVGGATRMPIIKETLHLLLKRDILDSLDPDKTVAIGAALQAYNLVSRSGDLLLDVTPLSLKLELADGSADTIIPRNSAIPANASRVFTTHVDGQAGFVLKILQGESVMASGCRVLGEYELSGIPKMPAGTARLEVTFQIDADGILLVHAEEKISGITQEVMLKPSFGLTAENMMRF